MDGLCPKRKAILPFSCQKVGGSLDLTLLFIAILMSTNSSSFRNLLKKRYYFLWFSFNTGCFAANGAVSLTYVIVLSF